MRLLHFFLAYLLVLASRASQINTSFGTLLVRPIHIECMLYIVRRWGLSMHFHFLSNFSSLIFSLPFRFEFNDRSISTSRTSPWCLFYCQQYCRYRALFCFVGGMAVMQRAFLVEWVMADYNSYSGNL